MSKYLIPAAVLALGLSQTVHAACCANNLRQIGIATFEGTDRNWFNPANWSTGRVPGENDIAVLDGADDVVIDPSQANGRLPGKVNVNTIWVQDGARLETLPGTDLAADVIVIEGQGQLDADSTPVGGSLLYVADQAVVNLRSSPLRSSPLRGSPLRGSPLRGSPLRGSPLRSSPLLVQGTLKIGLGGREPAGVQKIGPGTIVYVGAGYYSNTQGGNVVLGNFIGTDASGASATGGNVVQGNLIGTDVSGMAQARARVEQIRHVLFKQTESSGANRPDTRVIVHTDVAAKLSVSLNYDFKPARGDTFQILTADALVGEFDGLPEGALVGCTEDDSIGLWITYRGGDGNDVVLDARPGEPEVCATREHILLARQVGVPR